MFAELSPARYPSPAPSIHDNVAVEPLPDVGAVLSYLDTGHVLNDMMDVEDDPFDPTQQILNRSTMVTDGEWLGRQDFTYYVRYHAVSVPQEFFAAIRARSYAILEVPESRLGSVPEVGS
jgi:hypothetical protein